MSAEEIRGNCPLCESYGMFRELSFTENLADLGGFVGGFFSGKAAKHASVLANSSSDSREFPNYKCDNCGGKVMQCSRCKEIIPYAHDGTSHTCGTRRR